MYHPQKSYITTSSKRRQVKMQQCFDVGDVDLEQEPRRKVVEGEV